MDPQQTNNIYIGDNEYTKDDVSDNKFTNYGNQKIFELSELDNEDKENEKGGKVQKSLYTFFLRKKKSHKMHNLI